MSNEQTEALVAWRRREIQMIGAAISTRDWHGVETAYNQLRDKIDTALATPSPAPSDTLVEAETYRAMHEIARDLGYPSILEALEAAPPCAPMTDTLERREAMNRNRVVEKALREAQDRAEREFGIKWVNLEEVSRFELFFDALTTSPRVDEGRAREVLAEEMRKCALPHAAEIDYIARSDGPIPAHWLTAAIIRAMLRFATTPADPRVDEGRAREVLVDGPWFLIAIGGKVGDRFRNTIILDCSPDMKELGPEFHWEDTFETDPPEHLPAGAYVWSGFQLGGWAEDDPIVAKGGTFTPHAALATTPADPRVGKMEAVCTCEHDPLCPLNQIEGSGR